MFINPQQQRPRRPPRDPGENQPGDKGRLRVPLTEFGFVVPPELRRRAPKAQAQKQPNPGHKKSVGRHELPSSCRTNATLNVEKTMKTQSVSAAASVATDDVMTAAPALQTEAQAPKAEEPKARVKPPRPAAKTAPTPPVAGGGDIITATIAKVTEGVLTGLSSYNKLAERSAIATEKMAAETELLAKAAERSAAYADANARYSSDIVATLGETNILLAKAEHERAKAKAEDERLIPTVGQLKSGARKAAWYIGVGTALLGVATGIKELVDVLKSAKSAVPLP